MRDFITFIIHLYELHVRFSEAFYADSLSLFVHDKTKPFAAP